MTLETKSVAFRVAGRVQGVSFRAWTEAEARRLGLSGLVRNRDDGDVEGVAAGPTGAVDTLLARLNEGPRLARVARVDTEPTDAPAGDGFEIRA
ncbi:acylphosphatase [Rhodovulum sp. 12E13]|uniref:acylphosphatase n=1 Tax=Rhodovulum sp. 12E13 TaxID=2203891 RepID=UPI000E156A53|nr:acylphosphatase [Rhodovulum sp. 12E13]RDC74819.1 acylphosphatase [Rhodovulum sp. 12E13]